MNSAGLLNFSSREPREIIMEMYRIRRRILLGEDIDMPRITLMLWPEGTHVSGFVLDVTSAKSDHHIALQLSDTQTTGDVFYAYLGAVRGVVVRNIEHYEHILCEVTADTTMNRPPSCTKMDLQRRMSVESKKLSDARGVECTYNMEGNLPEGAQALFVMSNVVTDVTICLLDLMQTDLGREAVISEINKISFRRTESEFSITKSNKEFIVSGKFDTSFTTSHGRWKLKEQLESLL